MLEVELKSRELKEYLYLELDKNRLDPIYDEDLNKITELDLDRFDLIEEQTDMTLEDIVFFKNLKTCYLGNFILDDKNIRLLNTRKQLQFLQINDCIFDIKDEILSLNVEHLVIIDSENVNLSKYEDKGNLKNLKIMNCSNTNINGISNFKNLSKVYLQNLNLDNINEMAKMKNLNYVNLNGSIIKDDYFEKSNTEFIIVHDEINAIYDSED